MDDYAKAASNTAQKIGAAASDEVVSLREQVTKLSNQVKECTSPESIDEVVHESPYIIAAVALIVGLVVGAAVMREPQKSYWR
jgi:ElaB/YqjD/DUF883 family membrane-anchored ribosome-binding protein